MGGEREKENCLVASQSLSYSPVPFSVYPLSLASHSCSAHWLLASVHHIGPILLMAAHRLTSSSLSPDLLAHPEFITL